MANNGEIFDGVDQLYNLIDAIRYDSNSRRMMVSAWNVSELSDMVLPPCHYGFQVYVNKRCYGFNVATKIR